MDKICYLLFVLILLTPALAKSSSPFPVQESKFHRGIICDVDTRIHHGCSRRRPKIRGGLMPCLQACGRDAFCIGASLHRQNHAECFHHEACPADVPCDGQDSNHTFWLRHCVHGVWNSSASSCACLLGCSGHRCEICPITCQGLISAGYKTGHHRTILDLDQDGKNPLKVVCYVKPPSYHHVRIMANSGGVDFNRTWHEYIIGFFQDVDNLWSGFGTWFYLSRAGFTNVVTELTLRGSRGARVWREYPEVVVNDESTLISLSVNGRSKSFKEGNMHRHTKFGDCFKFASGKAFSTWDRDNDGVKGENCAAYRGSGWWYSSCTPRCNLFGQGFHDWYGTPRHRRLKILSLSDGDYPKRIEIFLRRRRKTVGY